jgi:hypothetical protein
MIAFDRLTKENLPRYKERLAKLTADAKPTFGQLSPDRMLRHCRLIIQMSLEEVEVTDTSNIFTRGPLRIFAFHLMPDWPKAKLKGPDEVTPPSEFDFDGEMTAFLEALDRFCEEAEKNPDRKTLHPFFGKRTLKYWEHVHGRHFEHHFRQYNL